jgi:PKHD-type hydroxylase
MPGTALSMRQSMAKDNRASLAENGLILQIPGILNQTELDTLRAELGRARFEDGAATAGYAAREVKRNLQVPQDSEIGRKCAPIVVQALQRNPIFFSAALPHRLHGPVFNRYEPGMTYGEHVDNALMGMPATVRTDVSATLFLSAPQDYDGGELVVQESGGEGLKLAAGSIVIYPSTSAHRVLPVRRGARLAAVLWIQSLVRDDMQRRLLFELDVSLGALREKLPAAAELATLTAIYHNLLRQWAET